MATTLPGDGFGIFKYGFRLQAGESGHLSVVNLQGKVVHQRVVQGERLELANATSGLYLLRLER